MKNYRISCIVFILSILFSGSAIFPIFKPLIVYAPTQLTSNIPLNFPVTNSIKNPTKPIIYFTDMARAKIYSVNYETKEMKSLDVKASVDKLIIFNNELYVTMVGSEEDKKFSESNIKGAVAIIDTDTLTLKDKFYVDFKPFDISIDRQGYIYLFPDYAQGNVIKTYSRSTKQEISKYARGTGMEMGVIHPIFNKLYIMDTAVTPVSWESFDVENGKLNNSSRQSNLNIEGFKPSMFKLSPDGKYIFYSGGTVLKASSDHNEDLTYVTTLNTAFLDIAFDIDNNRIYTVTGSKEVTLYEYSTFKKLGIVKSTGKIKNLFYQNKNLMAVSKDYMWKYFIEQIPLDVNNPHQESNSIFQGDINSAVYDLKRDKIYAIDSIFKKLYIINAADNKMESSISLPYTPSGLTIAEDGAKIYIVNDNDEYLVSELNLTTLKNTRNLTYNGNRNMDPILGHRHIYNKQNKLFIVNGEWSPKLLLFNEATFEQIMYTPQIDEIGDLSFSEDGKYMYKWQQYGWLGGSAQTDIYKYSIDQSSFTQVDQSNLSFYTFDKNPLDTPMILLQDRGQIIYKNTVFNLNNLKDVSKGSFGEPIYAVDSKNNIAVGEKKIYDLNTHAVLRPMPNHDSNILIFDKHGLLHYFKDKNIYSLNLLLPVGSIKIESSSITQNANGISVNELIKIKFDDNIHVTKSTSISLLDGTSRDFKVQTNGNTLEIAHKDFPYNTKVTIKIEADAVNDTSGYKFNNEFTLNFTTMKELNRISGSDRYDTSINISKEGWNTSQYAVLATGKDYPDALSAAPLAKKYNAPILLTDSKILMSKTDNELSRLAVKEVFIIGGYGAVSKDIEDKLIARNVKVTRIKGENRYETALQIAKYLGESSEVFVVTGSNFPDALSIASYAASKEIPILLTEKDNLKEEVKKYIQEGNVSKSYVIGGQGIISDAVLNTLPNAERISGGDRYDTNLRVIKRFDIYASNSYIATGENFPDALSCSALAGKWQAPIVLVNKGLSNYKYLFEIDDYNATVKSKYIVGGEGAIPSSEINKLHQ